MQNLGDVIGAILTQINHGRALADRAAVELADAYRDNPRLSWVKAPRGVVDEVVIELRVAFAEGALPSGVLTLESASAALDALLAVAADLPAAVPVLNGYFSRFPELASSYQSALAPIKERLWGLLFANASIPADVIAKHASSILSEHLLKAFLGPGVPERAAQGYMAEAAAGVDMEIARLVSSAIHDLAAAHREGSDVRASGAPVPVFVTASELEAIPEEKISTLRFRLNDAGRA